MLACMHRARAFFSLRMYVLKKMQMRCDEDEEKRQAACVFVCECAHHGILLASVARGG